MHPGGFLVGFKGRQLRMSVPYRPHAWPEEYTFATEHPIVGLGVYDNHIVVLTTGHPYIVSGSRPEALSPIKYERALPCSSARAICNTLEGVLFPSRDGMYLVGHQGINAITDQLLSESQWQEHNPSQLSAVYTQNSVLGFYDTDEDFLAADVGFRLAPSDPGKTFSHVVASSAECPMCAIDNVQVDPYTDRVILLSDNKIYWYDPPGAAPLTYTWRSKFFTTPSPVNFGAADVAWRDAAYVIHPPRDYHGSELVFTLYSDTLDVTNAATIRRSTQIDLGARANVDSPLYTPQKVLRLKSGFKADSWWFTLRGTAVVEYVKIAETGRGLAAV